MSHLFLAKILNGHPANFVRFEGPDSFIVEVNGVEQAISRDHWGRLPESRENDQDWPQRDPGHGS
jgi:hypothetical protein